jgi:hypothetical protein
MLIGVMAWLALLGGGQSSSAPERGNLNEELYYASNYASGRKVCDRRLSNQLVKRFTRRFGSRIEKLRSVHTALYGPDPEFIVTTSCMIPSEEYDQDEEMRKFEPVLRKLERRFGSY